MPNSLDPDRLTEGPPEREFASSDLAGRAEGKALPISGL
jgi:hypothetical protein